ncbi:MAG: hypothetical protein Ct9H300mP23_11010 [Nitrospinota bacterium]|nr:MAG: hypothetical protein Ct9H300mP23_11010 [Nitrospinota bacterium]
MEGEAILEASKEVKGSGLEVLAVTLLTSMGEEQLNALGFEHGTKNFRCRFGQGIAS